MTLTATQERFAFNAVVNELLQDGPITYTKTELKTIIADAEAWAALPATRIDYNSNLTAGNFKSNATDAQKGMVLEVVLEAVRKVE